MRMVVVGGSGQVARALKSLAADGLDIVTLGRPHIDLTRADDCLPVLAPLRPDVLVNAAAWTAVDRAEAERDLAFATNAAGAARLAAAAAAIGCPFIHLSTDYVFDAPPGAPIGEDAPTAPRNVYGSSKLAGEQAVRLVDPAAVVLRTSWVYAPFGANFLQTMLRLAAGREEIAVVSDQFGIPTSALDIADALVAIARNLLARPGDAALRGLFHMSARGAPVSWAGFAEAIFERAAPRGLPVARIRKITTREYPTAAQRPAWSVLDSARLARVHGVRLPDWRDGLERVMRQLHGEHGA